MKFSKYHALGNDYLVMTPADCPNGFTRDQIRSICHRNFGIGSDGILYGPLNTNRAQFGLNIFNPDGSEAEKSGNGLRIFCRYLWDSKQICTDEFTVDTKGGVVRAKVFDSGRNVRVDMGRVSFDSAVIPVAGGAREVINETIEAGGKTLTYCAATIGNPHCVVPVAKATSEMAHALGPLLEIHPNFPNRTNVQFLEVLDRANVRIEIWERGAGYTLASGSSSSAAASVARKLGLVDKRVTVHSPGGTLLIEIGDDYAIRMTGPVTRVGEGVLDAQLFEDKLPS